VQLQRVTPPVMLGAIGFGACARLRYLPPARSSQARPDRLGDPARVGR